MKLDGTQEAGSIKRYTVEGSKIADIVKEHFRPDKWTFFSNEKFLILSIHDLSVSFIIPVFVSLNCCL